jgi:hypothetical protein
MWNGDAEDDEESRRLSLVEPPPVLAEHDAESSDSHESSSEDDSDDSDRHDPSTTAAAATASSSGVPARGKPEAMAAKLAMAARLQQKMDELEMEDDVVAVPLDDSLEMTMDTVDTVATLETQKDTPKKKSKKKTPSKKPAPKGDLMHPTMDDPTPDHVTDAQYQNLESMLVQFCRVPLLAEFSRPVALLHPEVRRATRAVHWLMF